MRLAIIGLSNSGKTTVFNALTRQNIETTIYPTVTGEPNYGIVKVPDYRVDKLAEIYKPKKVTYATVEYVDYIGLTKGDITQNRKVFDLIKDVDAIVHVIRAFEDDAVLHPMNEVNPMRDIEILELELIFGDLELAEKRLARMEEGAKKGKKPNEAEKRLLLKCKDALEKEIPLRNVSFDNEEQKVMKHLQFVSIKPEVVVLNVGEKDLNTEKEKKLLSDVDAYFRAKNQDPSLITRHASLSLCGKVEMEIAQLNPDEARAFLDDLGIQEPALNKLIQVSYDLLGLISFLTCGEDEVRAWTIKKGINAQQAAGKIHSDIERGFIRAEVINFDDFISVGSMSLARDKGLLRLEGKTYEVKDGDIINFRFNV
ncbi:GTP-binding protein [Dissulfurispira thermophila]|uniref:Ribosome-binding ATPase YchF n=2 Tax=root TaxID=1 RepID=A0A7G1H0B4_9BACT|nr:redox-regulated ATPase YchF [Dissulfurispira thermophila]BCB96225.1 GTP-binding protein [Dissulfurispira thermophila]